MEHRRAVDRDERRDYDLHARRRFYRSGNELVAGDVDDSFGKLHRADSDDFERARRDEIRRFVSGFVSRFIRNEGREYSGDTSGDCRLRLVRDSDLDRRDGD